MFPAQILVTHSFLFPIWLRPNGKFGIFWKRLENVEIFFPFGCLQMVPIWFGCLSLSRRPFGSVQLPTFGEEHCPQRSPGLRLVMVVFLLCSF